MKLYLLVFTVLFLSSCVKPIDIDIKETKLLFNQLKFLKIDRLIIPKKGTHPYMTRFLVVDSILYNDKFILRACKQSLIKEDLKYIEAQLASHTYNKWQQSIFDDLKVMSMKRIDSLSKPDPFINTPPFIKLSKPYFSKNGTYCLLLYSYYCGNLCAESAVSLYKKVSGKWEFVKSFDRRVS